MRAARRHPRATKQPPSAARDRGIKEALAQLHSPVSISPERAAAIERELQRAPYLPLAQRELELPT